MFRKLDRYQLRTLWAVLGVMCFATYGAFGKALVESIHPILVALYVYGISVSIFFFFFGFIPEVRQARLESANHVWHFFLFSLFSGTLGPILLLGGLQHTSATNAILFTNVYPVFFLILSVILLKKKVRSTQIAGMAILMLGICVIALGGQTQGMGLNYGDLMVFVAQLSFAVGDMIYKVKLKKMHPHIAVLGRNSLAFATILVISLFWFPEITVTLTNEIVSTLIMIAVIPILIAQFLWYRSVKKVPAVTLSRIALLNPVFGVFFAWLLLAEPLYFYHFIGLGLVIVGLGVSQIKRHYHPINRNFHFHTLHHPHQQNGNNNGHWWDFLFHHREE